MQGANILQNSLHLMRVIPDCTTTNSFIIGLLFNFHHRLERQLKVQLLPRLHFHHVTHISHDSLTVVWMAPLNHLFSLSTLEHHKGLDTQETMSLPLHLFPIELAQSDNCLLSSSQATNDICSCDVAEVAVVSHVLGFTLGSNDFLTFIASCVLPCSSNTI